MLTDLHVGREFGDYDGPGYDDSGTPVSGLAAGYAQDAVNEINKIASSQNIAFVAVLGDLTEAAEASELRAAKQILDNLAVPWIPVMGNHDTWPNTVNEIAPPCCPPVESYFDTIMGVQYAELAAEMPGWGKESPALVYDPEAGRDTYFQNFFFDYGGFHFIFLDFNDRLGYPEGQLHDFPGGTWSWFKEHMQEFVQQDPERSGDVILLAHHPMREDGAYSDKHTFTAAELDDISDFTNNAYYSYVDSSGNPQTRPFGSRIWGQLAGHRHPATLRVDYPPWANGGPVLTYPRNLGGVRIGLVKMTSATPGGVDYSDPTVATEAATNISSISATLNGYLASLGTPSEVQVSFEWGTTTSYGFETALQTMSWPDSFSFDLSGLSDGTTYHFRAKAAGNGITLGSDMAFVAMAPPLAVATHGATSVAAASATLNGDLAGLGTASSVDVSFEWGPTTSYGNVTTPETRTGTGTFSAGLTTLAADTQYHYRAKAVGDNTTYGSDVTFFTDPLSAPAVLSNPATGMTTTSAILRGELDDLGSATSVVVAFEWGTASGSYTETTQPQTLDATGAFFQRLSGLTPGTTYYYRARADGDGVDEGDEMSFTTSIVPPSVSTNGVSNVTVTSATLNGELDDLGTADSVIVAFEWGTVTGLYVYTTDTRMLSGSTTFFDEVVGLTPGTTYYYRAKADGDGGTVYGQEESFATATTPPSVATNAASDVAATSAVVHGNLADLGTAGTVVVSFHWGTASGSYTETTNTQPLSASGAFSDELRGLAPGTTYYYRAKADGHGDTVYGLEQSFTTSVIQPAVSTIAASNVGATSATLNGELSALGTAGTVVVSFQWGTASGSYTETTAPQTLDESRAFSVELSGLTPGTTCYCRAMADGDGDTVYGQEETFTTTTTPPSVATNAASDVVATSAAVHGELADLGTAGIVVVAFQWGTASGSYNETTTSQTLDGSAAFSDELRGLTPGTTYYYRAMADGDGSTVYGQEESFTTAIVPPTQNPDPPSDPDPKVPGKPVNAAPVPADADYSLDVSQGSTLEVSAPGVLGNYTDRDGDTLTAVLVSGPSHGNLTLNADGSLSYAPDRGFSGTDSFTYKVSDGQLESEPASVTIKVVPAKSASSIVGWVQVASAVLATLLLGFVLVLLLASRGRMRQSLPW